MPHAVSPKTYYLFPGTLFAPREPYLVTTVLGSCVAVCLWDPLARLGGINHFQLPLWNGEELPTPKYGNIAIAQLIEKLLELGCGKARLVAKVFGGSSLWAVADCPRSVGERNIELAWHQLAEQGIPVVGSDVGGTAGRKIILDTNSGKVLMRRNRANFGTSTDRHDETDGCRARALTGVSTFLALPDGERP